MSFLYAKNRKGNNMNYQINLEHVVFDKNKGYQHIRNTGGKI